jgi:hypothetical protein
MPYRAVGIEDRGKDHGLVPEKHLRLDLRGRNRPGIPHVPRIGVSDPDLLDMRAVQLIIDHSVRPRSPRGCFRCYSTALDLAQSGASLCLWRTRRCQGGDFRHIIPSFFWRKFYLDTGGYNAETCEAERTWSKLQSTELRREAAPP